MSRRIFGQVVLFKFLTREIDRSSRQASFDVYTYPPPLYMNIQIIYANIIYTKKMFDKLVNIESKPSHPSANAVAAGGACVQTKNEGGKGIV